MGPLVVGIWSTRAEPSWADDAAIVRDLGFVPMGLAGTVSTLVTQLVALLPLGSRFERLSLVGVLALALASRLLFGALLDLLERRARTALNPALACFASSLWALAPAVQQEAWRAGGALPAIVLVLCTERLAAAAFGRGEPALLAATGLCWGALLAESPSLAAGLGLWIFALAVYVGRRRLARELWRLLAGAAGVPLLAASLRWLRPDGLTLSLLAGVPAPGSDAASAPAGVLELWRSIGAGWVQQLGALPLALAAAGVAVAMLSRSLRRRAVPWLGFALLPPLLAWPTAAALPPVLGVLSSLGVVAFFPLAVQALVSLLWASGLPLSRPAAVLSVSFAATLVLARTDGPRPGELPARSGTRLWTQRAFEQLPPDSLLLVESPALVLRLLAARTLQGTRPDVRVLSSALLAPGALRTDPALSGPELLPLLRELWVKGSVGEFSLTRLADERPVFTELVAGYDRRLLEHLRPDAVWLAVSAPALGPSERRAAALQSRGELQHMLDLAGGLAALDPGTRRVLADAAASQSWLLLELGEREAAARLLRAARRLDRATPLGRERERPGAVPTQGRVAAGNRLL